MVELACLENKCAFIGTEGSNPSLSAMNEMRKIIESLLALYLIALALCSSEYKTSSSFSRSISAH